MSQLRGSYLALLMLVGGLGLATLVEPFHQTSAYAQESGDEFPEEFVHWEPYSKNPIFTASGPDHWDVKIRERGWILKEDNQWSMWFTGYDGTPEGQRNLG